MNDDKITLLMAQAQAMIEKVAEMRHGNFDRKEGVTADIAERKIFEEAMKFGFGLFDLFLAGNGNGDVGPKTYSRGVSYKRHSQVSSKNYQSIFGMNSYKHMKYYPIGVDPKIYYSPYESLLNIQERRSSYLVQDMLSSLAVNMPMGESASVFEQFFSMPVSKRSVDDIVVEQSAHLEAYEEQRNADCSESEGDLMVVTFDGKGVSMLEGSRVSEGTKRMAMIGVDYTVDRHVRTASEVAANLIGSQFSDTNLAGKDEQSAGERLIPHACNKHYQVSIEDKETVFSKIKQSVDQRLSAGQKLVVLVDGAPELRTLTEEYFSHASAYILDIIHVVGYLGKSIKILYSPGKYRRQLYSDIECLLSSGEAGAKLIVENLKTRLDEKKINKTDRKHIRATITYFNNNYDRMKYDQYLAAGYPIATGVVESACGMLVCDRMDFAGARWHLRGAEGVLKMRALKKSNEWQAYQEFRKEKEYQRLYAQAA